MSEYQYVAFRAIDRPVSEKDLAFMQKQSSRAEITRWSFDNEYHYGDFHGNALEMMRRGYDIHLHYANYGIRSLFIRLPHGMPDAKATAPYLDGESLKLVKDKDGHGATLTVEPFYEPGELDELWDIDELLDRLIPLRAEILRGDLRPLYLAQLAICCDGNHDCEDTIEVPVPAGLGEPTEAQLALAEYLGIDRSLIAAAARGTLAAPPAVDQRPLFSQWLGEQAETAKNGWLTELMAEPDSSVRAELLTAFNKKQHRPSWPTVERRQSIAQLQAEAKEIQDETAKKEAAAAVRARARKLAKMADDPAPYLKKAEQLIGERSTHGYQQASSLLADVREALGGSTRSDLAETQARKFHDKHPRLHHLTAALRREGFIPK